MTEGVLPDRVAGVILGTAVGDAIGLPREQIPPRRAARLFGGPPLGHRLLPGRGMISDDTEHTCMLAQALLASGGQPRRFARSFAWRLRLWLLGLPAGVGMGTARGIVKLWMGFPPSRSGVRSAGNGPAMRAALLGVWAGADHHRLAELVAAATRLTHRDERAEQGAMAVALAAGYAAVRDADSVQAGEVFALLREYIHEPRLAEGIAAAEAALAEGWTGEQFVQDQGWKRGVTGYVVHTVPAALLCWLRHPGDFRAAVEEVIMLGGDADTTGAIVGALAGATVGASGIPPEWLDGLWEWPRSVKWMRKLSAPVADAIEAGDSEDGPGPVPLFWPALLPRNLLFLMVVLLHGFRRVLPPY